MQAIDSVRELKNAIRILEAEQELNRRLLKEEFYLASRRFNPFDLLRSSLKNIPLSPYIVDTLIVTAVGLAINYFVKKSRISSAGYIIRKFIVTVLKLGLNKVVVQKSDSIRSLIRVIFQHLVSKKEIYPQSSER